MIMRLSDSYVFRGSFLSPNIWGYVNTMHKILGRPKRWRESLSNHDFSPDIAIAALEQTSPTACMTLKASYQESPVYTFAYARKLFSSKWAAGTDLTYLKSSSAVVSSYGARYKSDNLISSLAVTCSPNFEKPINEGLKEKIYGFRTNFVTRISDRITAAAEIESNPLIQQDFDKSLDNLKENFTVRLGYEYQFAQARVCGSIDNNWCLQQTIEDATGESGLVLILSFLGIQMSGELDFKNDNYRFGFGFELSPSLVTGRQASESS